MLFKFTPEMKKLVLLLSIITISLSAFTQETSVPCTTDDTSADPVYVAVDTMPSFPGGNMARVKFLQDNMHFPDLAREKRIQGTVYVTFIVEKDGKVSNVRILSGIGGGCDEESMRVVKLLPPWNPGKCGNNPVRVQMNMPLKYTLGSGYTDELHSEKKMLKKKKKSFLF